MAKYIMGIDNGGTATKAAIYDLKGNEIAKHTETTTMITPKPFFTERDINELLQANIFVIQKAIEKAKISAEEIVGISCTGHGNGLYLLGENYLPVRDGIISTDNRAVSYIRKWYADPRFETDILPRTMQSVWAGQPVALLAWLNDHEPEVVKETKYIFMVKDLIRYYLTGEATLEVTDISGTNLINLKTKNYDDVILNFFGIENWKDKLPRLINSTDVGGRVTAEMAEITGLKAGTPVAGGVFDIASSAIAAGLTEENQLAIITGTWSINEYITSKPTIEKDLFMTSIYPLENEWLVTEASPTSASNLEWFINTFMSEEKKICKEQGQSIYDLCNDMVALTKPDDNDLFFFPFIFGSNTIDDATAGFIGATSFSKKEHFVRAIYEGVVFSHMYHIDKLRPLNENLTGKARIAGGITNSEVWLKIFANVLNMPLEIVNVKESGTLGTAMAAAVMIGEYSDMKDAAKHMIRVGETIEPDQSQLSVYRKKYEKYCKLLEAMEKTWETLND